MERAPCEHDARVTTQSPAQGTASPRMPSPAGPASGSGAGGADVRKGSRSRRPASRWVTVKAAELMMRMGQGQGYGSYPFLAAACPLLTGLIYARPVTGVPRRPSRAGQ
ncbi:hypothetical protein Mame01_44880 [Microbispora amethystogenes]|nr:hypothetical protein Mame01_44880 [Microbispora amethystogenes]